MKIVAWQIKGFTLFPYFVRSRSNVEVGGRWWPEWYAFIGPFQIRIWERSR